MEKSQNHEAVGCRSSRCRILIIVLAICGLTVSLATRTFWFTTFQGATVTSNTAQAVRQHMNRDAVEWEPPVPVFTQLQVPVLYPPVAQWVPPLTSVLFDESLSNRPPPSC